MARTRMAAGAGLSLGAALGMGATAHGADFTVSNLTDPGPGSLREALQDAQDNDNPAAVDRVLFLSSVTGTITLNGTELPYIDEPLQVVGPGAGTLTVSGDDASRIFYVQTAVGADVTISGLTLRDGQAGEGGAIRSLSADLTIRDSTISDSRASKGGGLVVQSGSAVVERSTISGNETVGTGGGGIYSGEGLTIKDSTISNNRALAGGLGRGGGVTSYGSAALTVENSTLSGNSASVEGGGIFASNNLPDPVLTNTVVADNTAPLGPDLRAVGAPPDTVTLAFSLIEDPAGAGLTQTGPNVFGLDPQLSPLALNGGSTRTHALGPTSPAVDTGSATGTDQRGLPRPVDFLGAPNATGAGANAADIGAFEFQPPRCAGVPATMVATGPVTTGTAKRDVIVGTDEPEVIRARGGNDLVCARGGNDKTIGGPGRDILRGEAGRDRLVGGGGRDRLLGGGGRDRLRGGPGQDKLRGGPGRDTQVQ